MQLVEDEPTWHKIVTTREVIGSYLRQQIDGLLSSAELVSNLGQLEEAMDEMFRREMELNIKYDTCGGGMGPVCPPHAVFQGEIRRNGLQPGQSL